MTTMMHSAPGVDDSKRKETNKHKQLTLVRVACAENDNEGIRTLAGRAQWISSPSP